MRIAVITLVSGRHAHLALQQRGLAAGTRRPDHYVVVAVDDPAVPGVLRGRPPSADVVPVQREDGRLPLAAARNTGARRALTSGADVLVFLDVDCVPGPTLVARYAEAAEDGALLGGTVAYLDPPPAGGYRLAELAASAPPHPGRPVPADGEVLRGGDHRLFWSLSFALTAPTWERIGGFCERYTGYGGEDTDFARGAAARGVGLWWVGGAPAYHQHHPVSHPPVEHLDDILRNGAVYRSRWGHWPMGGWLRDFARLGLAEHDPVTDTWRRTEAGRSAQRQAGNPVAMDKNDVHKTETHEPGRSADDSAADEAVRELAALHREDDTGDPPEEEKGIGDPLRPGRHANQEALTESPSDPSSD
ncbi:galactosyltransferase-related protein [Streptomyces sp. NPDC010273]|uniref:glycosyltransferase family 2 protein n=1 Tax=Streptomyces sp. NPDC010273 TaxID=3364829 RepID=UPI0036EB35AE